MKRYALFLSIRQLCALQALAQQLGLKVSELIRRAIDEYLDRHAR